jgi:large subunit GTPase 1
MLTHPSRRSWAEYFDKEGVEFAFFSAANAVALQRMQSPDPAQAGADRPTGIEDDLSPFAEPRDMEVGRDNDQSSEPSDEDAYFSAEEDLADHQSPKVKVLSVVELKALFEEVAPAPSGERPFPCFPL